MSFQGCGGCGVKAIQVRGVAVGRLDITLTKLVGVAVLAGAQTQIFELYYFR